ncbi:phage holin family protein [Paracoccus caeni]|uniref:Phage holin family protein n=1 Tax=Paracoccus caeni TaxID=657651 RepID=A0A934SHQ5_9RHOB|nr:phage holin family protein [Paracoccus caeni]MBK4217286.1 phage holin family protein [Paracoccus caeni]
MFDYAQRLKLALGDTARRTGLKVGAGAVLVVGLGFLLAALWSWLAHDLDWGPTFASLTVGGGFILIALILLLMARKPKHVMPTSDDLKREVEARVTLAKEAAVERVRGEANRVLDMAGNKATSLMDDASYRANKLASDAERKVMGVAQSVGLTSDRLSAAGDKVARASDSNAGSMAKLLGAFAVGVTLAAKLQERRRSPGRTRREDYDEDDFV